MCLELPDGPWPVPAPAETAFDAEGAGAMVAEVSQDVNEDALSLYDLPVDSWTARFIRKMRGIFRQNDPPLEDTTCTSLVRCRSAWDGP